MLKALILSILSIDLLHPVASKSAATCANRWKRHNSAMSRLPTTSARSSMDDAEPPLFTGPAGREATGSSSSAIAWHESGFRKLRRCLQGGTKQGRQRKINRPTPSHERPQLRGHSANEICQDRRLAIGPRAARAPARQREFARGCHAPGSNRYAAGGCGNRSKCFGVTCVRRSNESGKNTSTEFLARGGAGFVEKRQGRSGIRKRAA